MAIIGIDLGTTNSLVSVFRNGKVELIKNVFGTTMIPSAVAIDEEGRILVGQSAREQKYRNSSNCALEFKRQMGNIEKIRLGEKTYLPEELSAFVLKKCKQEAEQFLQEEVTEAIISVPAYFDNMQREATRRAARIAGLNNKRLLNEPSAAALAHRMETGLETEQFIMVIDFGGGTLDVSLVDCFENIVEIIGVAGDNQLGGKNFDEQIAKAFMKETGLDKQELSKQEKSLIIRIAEETKIALGSNEKVLMNCRIREKLYTMELTQEKIIEICGQLLLQLKEVMVRAIKDTGCSLADITDVVVAGGCGQLKMVRDYLEQLFHREIMITSEVQELVAKGLGYYAGILGQQTEVADMIVTDVCPFSLGVDINGEGIEQIMSVIIPKNTTLPKRVTKKYVAASPMQRQLKFSVYQGEQYYAKENKKIGEMSIILKRVPGICQEVETTLAYDLNGILSIEVKDEFGTKRKKHLLGTMETCNEEVLLKESYLPKELEQYSAIHEKLLRLYEQANEGNKMYLARLIAMSEFAKEKFHYVDAVKQFRLLEECISGYEEQFNSDPFAIYEEMENDIEVTMQLEGVLDWIKKRVKKINDCINKY